MFIFVVMGCLLFLMGCVLFGFEVVRFVDERKEKREEEIRRELEKITKVEI